MLQHNSGGKRAAQALARSLRQHAGCVDCQKATRRLLPRLSADQLLAFANGLLPRPARPQPGSSVSSDATELLQVL